MPGLRSRRIASTRMSMAHVRGIFPSGKAFGYIAYPPRGADDVPYDEGFLFEGDGALIPARVVSAPFPALFQGGVRYE
jgi:hypothetical protein